MYPYLFFCYLPHCIFYCPICYLKNTHLNHDKMSQFRKSKNEKIYIPEVVELIACFNPAILNTKEFNCIARLNARKIVQQMLKSHGEFLFKKN